MKTACPQCGAEIEFRFDDSFVRVCGSCRAAVARTDRGIQTLGQFADLVPVQSPLSLFAEGTYGGMGFILVGKAQIRHAAGGMWQEWYAKFGSGVWGWLAEAQGRYYMTFEVPNLPVTPHYQLQPGAQRNLPTRAGERTFTVSEVGVATFVAADGELPYRLVPGSMFRYADLADGQGGFATIDYGPPEARDPRVGPTEPPSIYIGGQIRFEDLHISGGITGVPGAGPRVTSQRLACPNCNGSIELRAPDASLRVVCPYCNSMLDVSDGALTYLKGLDKKPQPALPLGAIGRFTEAGQQVELQVIGYLERSARVDGDWYPFQEYLLYSPPLGFRWLVCSDGHWSYVQPVANGACRVAHQGAVYNNTTFKHYQTGTLRVDQVYGELYWRAAAGNTSQGDDFILPPFMLSREEERGEVNWSLSTYLTPAEVREAFGEAGKQLSLPRPDGVAPNQVWPHRGFGAFYALLVIALLALGLVMAMSTHERSVTSFTFEVPSGKGPPLPAAPGEAAPPSLSPAGLPIEAPATVEAGHVFFSEPFAIREGENVEVRLTAPVTNSWAYYVVDLVDEEHGGFVTFDGNLEYYFGYDGGESWSEGSREKTQMLSPIPKGVYVARVEAMHGGANGVLPLQVTIRQNVFQGAWLLMAFIVVLVPGLLMFWSKRRFESRRWANSSFADDDDEGDD